MARLFPSTTEFRSMSNKEITVAAPTPTECSICKQRWDSSWYYGNNADPVNNGRCCDDCNTSVVMPARCAHLILH